MIEQTKYNEQRYEHENDFKCKMSLITALSQQWIGIGLSVYHVKVQRFDSTGNSGGG